MCICVALEPFMYVYMHCIGAICVCVYVYIREIFVDYIAHGGSSVVPTLKLYSNHGNLAYSTFGV